jgi:hypothetical protein
LLLLYVIKSYFKLLREGSLDEERRRVNGLKAPEQFACDPFASVSQSKCFCPRSQKIDVKYRQRWRNEFNRAVDPSGQRSKFPFAIYQDNSTFSEPNSREDAVRALVLRNSGIIKKRYPCMPSIVIAVIGPEQSDEGRECALTKEVQSSVRRCTDVDINPLSCVWYVSCLADVASYSQPQIRTEVFQFYESVLFYVIDDLIKDNEGQWKEFIGNVKEDYVKSHAAVDFVKSVLNADKHARVIRALSQAKSVVLVNNMDSETTAKSEFDCVCEMFRTFKFFDHLEVFKHRSDRSRVARVFVVPNAGAERRTDYVKAFRTGAHLLMLMDRGVLTNPLSSIKGSTVQNSLQTFYFFFQSVHLTLRSIELFFRYFLHHMAFVKQIRFVKHIRFPVAGEAKCIFFSHKNINIAERVQNLKKAFRYVLGETKIFHNGNNQLDWKHLCFMFQCMSLLQTNCMLSMDKDIKGMWEIFSQTEESKQGNKTKKQFFQFFDLAGLTNSAKNVTNEVHLANSALEQVLRTFTFDWYEPFRPDSGATDDNFWNPTHEIAQICESSKVFIVPSLQPEHMSFGFSRIAIDSHASASVRLNGETALMSAACSGNKKHVERLMQGCSLSQIMSRSEQSAAKGLDALFMCLFYAHIDVAKIIVQGILDNFSDDLATHPFCAHDVLGCTSFMLASRYGDQSLLDSMCQLLEKYSSNCSLSEVRDDPDSKRSSMSTQELLDLNLNRVLMRQDRNGANALHHAVIAANLEAVKWIKEKREKLQTESWYTNLNDDDREQLKARGSIHNIPDLDRPEGLYNMLQWKTSSVFQGGYVTEHNTRVLSPAFALIYNDSNQYAETDIRSFLKRTLHDDYTLLFVSLFAVDSRFMCQVDNETLSINVEPLQEYELAVLLWRWSDSNPCRERQSVQWPCDSESDLAIRLGNLKKEYELSSNCSEPPKPDDLHFDLARHMMKRCLRSKEEFHRRQELEQTRECNAKHVEVETRENIAQTLAEFTPGESSSWSEVFPHIEFALVALTYL